MLSIFLWQFLKLPTARGCFATSDQVLFIDLESHSFLKKSGANGLRNAPGTRNHVEISNRWDIYIYMRSTCRNCKIRSYHTHIHHPRTYFRNNKQIKRIFVRVSSLWEVVDDFSWMQQYCNSKVHPIVLEPTLFIEYYLDTGYMFCHNPHSLKKPLRWACLTREAPQTLKHIHSKKQ